MPRPLIYALIWSEEKESYGLHIYGQPERWFRPGDEAAFSSWVEERTAFAFVGQAGHLSVLKEARPRGASYWYAYRTQARHTQKRYLGATQRLTLAGLEQVAKELSELLPPSPLVATRAGETAGPSVTLLSTKLSPPRLPSFLVERTWLLTELEAVYTSSLTLVSASAGSGKTTLLSTWASRQEHPVAWLSLDTLDADPVRFWASCVTALRRYHPTLGEQALALLHAPQSPPLSSVLVSLLNDIALLDQEVILILDDFHLIKDQAIPGEVPFLFDQLPANLHLVLISRTDPQLPLSRLRVRGQLIEIRSSDLHFSREEAACFLRDGMGLLLTEEEVTLLSQRTEGWVAGLQLAALFLRKQQNLSAFVKDFGGSHRYLMDYVQQEIFMHLKAPLQDFLLQTSVVTSINASLCQAITASSTREASQQMLEEVERANLFVMPLDSRREWYRYHDLFREALLARLQAAQSDLVPLLHLRAARFYEAAGEPREAIAHAFSAADYAYAASLMEQAAPAFWVRGEVRTVHSWVLSLPDAVLRAHLRLALSTALRFIDSVHLSKETQHTSMVAQVERTFARLQELLHTHAQWALTNFERTLIGRRLRLLRALIELREIIKHGDMRRLWLLSQELEALPTDEEVSWSMISLSIAFWLNAIYQAEGVALLSRLREAAQMMIEAREHLVAVRVMSMAALVSLQAVQLRRAQQHCLEGLALIEQVGVRTVWEGYLYYSLFSVFYAQGKLEEAAGALSRQLQIAEDWQRIELQARGQIYSVRLALARGDLSTAEQARQRLEALVEQERFAYHLPWVQTVRVQVWLAQGNLEEAGAWAAQTTISEETWNPARRWEALMLVRVLLARGQNARAVEMLSRFGPFFDQPGDLQAAMEWMALSVVALHRCGEYEQAIQMAMRLLTLTEPEGYVRLDLDTGEPLMKEVLTIFLSASPAEISRTSVAAVSRPVVLRMLSALERSEQRPTRGRERSPVSLQSVAQQARSLSLSQQEQHVLRLLVVGKTYAEMAKQLVVSPNTIKTQVSSIYRKLGVSRRAEAIAVTAQLHLL